MTNLTEAERDLIKRIRATPGAVEAIVRQRDEAISRLRERRTIAETARLTGLSESTIKVVDRMRRNAS